jgi:hypothetical protein
MKKLIALLLLLTLSLPLLAEMESFNFPMATNSVTTGVLNVNKGSNYAMPFKGLKDVRFFASAPGNAAATNGNLVIYIEEGASRTGPWTLYSDSNIKITIPCTGVATNSASEKFDFTGIKWARIGAVSNSSAGTLTNFVLTVTSPQLDSHR